MASDSRDIAARLGVGDDIVRRLQARGYLLELDLTASEIRKRLFEAQRAFQLRKDRKQRRRS